MEQQTLDLAQVDIHDVIPMQADRWVLASSMQKAIRRGHVETAKAAGAGLWSADKSSFWRRLHTTALEDLGIGDVSGPGLTFLRG